MKDLEIGFLNVFGEYRSLIVPVNRYDEVLKNGLCCDGSSVGFNAKTENSDIRIFVDRSVEYPLPNGRTMLLASTNDSFDARHNLQEFEKRLQYVLNVGAELEFFLFDKNNLPNGKNFEIFENNNSYYCEIDKRAARCFESIMDYCIGTDIEIEACHHECAPYQYEIDFRFDTPCKTADKIVYLKRLIQIFAEDNGLVACFMPKPLNAASGSGMHTNISIFDGEKNMFYSNDKQNNLSEFAVGFCNNILFHIEALTHFACPNNNSYKRLLAGLESPTKICASASDRTAVIRIPKANKDGSRIEFRLPDISANPYTLFLAILKCGFYDVNDDIAVNGNMLEDSLREKSLPTDLKQSLEMLKKDDLLCNLVSNDYLQSKYDEYMKYQNRVSSTDFEMYFEL